MNVFLFFLNKIQAVRGECHPKLYAKDDVSNHTNCKLICQFIILLIIVCEGCFADPVKLERLNIQRFEKELQSYEVELGKKIKLNKLKYLSGGLLSLVAAGAGVGAVFSLNSDGKKVDSDGWSRTAASYLKVLLMGSLINFLGQTVWEKIVSSFKNYFILDKSLFFELINAYAKRVEVSINNLGRHLAFGKDGDRNKGITDEFSRLVVSVEKLFAIILCEIKRSGNRDDYFYWENRLKNEVFFYCNKVAGFLEANLNEKACIGTQESIDELVCNLKNMIIGYVDDYHKISVLH